MMKEIKAIQTTLVHCVFFRVANYIRCGRNEEKKKDQQTSVFEANDQNANVCRLAAVCLEIETKTLFKLS